MQDRLLMQEGKEQIYGTQGYGFASKGADGKPGPMQMFIWPVGDPENVNRRRKRSWLPRHGGGKCPPPRHPLQSAYAGRGKENAGKMTGHVPLSLSLGENPVGPEPHESEPLLLIASSRKMNRRKFIKNGSLAGLSLSTLAVISCNSGSAEGAARPPPERPQPTGHPQSFRSTKLPLPGCRSK